jgi:hypothetical protein
VAVERVSSGHPRLLGAGALAVAAVVAALAVPPYRVWRGAGLYRWSRDLSTVYWSVAVVTLAFAERELVAGSRGLTVTLWALTASVLCTAASPLAEGRLWVAGVVQSTFAAVTCLAAATVPSRLFVSSPHPGARLWALAAVVAALAWAAKTAPEGLRRSRPWLAITAAVLALFGLSLGVLEAAERLSAASVTTDFQRGHTALSAVWGALALGLFVAGLVRDEPILRRAGLTMFALALAKLFLYDLRSLSSITRALSFLAVGAILLAGAFFTERIIRGGGRGGHAGRTTA